MVINMRGSNFIYGYVNKLNSRLLLQQNTIK